MTWLHDKTTPLLNRIMQATTADSFPYFRAMQSLGSQVSIADKSYINYTSNDYLGLSQSPQLIDAACLGTQQFGTGLGSARPQATTIRHQLLEKRLADWLSYSGCAVFTTGYQAIVGTLQAFLDDQTTMVFDRLSHASMIDGALLAKGQYEDLEIRFFKHNSVAQLDKALACAANPKKMVVVEGLYSVDGDLAPLADIVAVARRHGAVVMVDDAHGIGSLGKTGKGVCELEQVLGEVDLLVGTFSKSFGSVGGFLCADSALIDYVKLTARSFVFSASLPLAQVEAALAALEIIAHDTTLICTLQQKGDYFRENLRHLGFNLGDASCHITPIFINDEQLTIQFAAALFHEASTIMMPFIAPGVPKGTERLRCNVTVAHSQAQMDESLQALAKLGRRFEV